MTARRFLKAFLAVCAALAWSGGARAYNELSPGSAASGSNSDITSLHSLQTAVFVGSPGAQRQLAWKTGANTIWGLSLTGSNDNTFGLFAYSPADGSFIGTAALFDSSALSVSFSWLQKNSVTASPAVSAAFGRTETFHNVGGNPAVGVGQTYFSNAGASNVAGFDVANSWLLVNNSTTFPGAGVAGMATDWGIAISPTVTGNWGISVEELDVVKRSRDDGLRTVRSTAANPTGAFLAVAEAQTFTNGGNTYNADWAYTVARSGGNGTSGTPNAFYIGFYCAENSIVGQAGYCNFAQGDVTSTPSRDPKGILAAGGAFVNGIDLSAATFTGSPLIVPLPTSAGSGGLYACVDSTGKFYERASCP